jgi:PAS domain S-box-containing protein
VNQTVCEMLGRSAQELLTMSWRQFTHPEDVDATAQAIERAARTPGLGGRLEKRYLRKDGSI